jgi:hypothetical protein
MVQKRLILVLAESVCGCGWKKDASKDFSYYFLS